MVRLVNVLSYVLLQQLAVISAGGPSSDVPFLMTAVHAVGKCGRFAPCENCSFSCVQSHQTLTPKPKAGHVLIKVKGTSINPCDVDTVQGGYGFGKTLCEDVAGVVVAIGPGCSGRIKVGDEVVSALFGIVLRKRLPLLLL